MVCAQKLAETFNLILLDKENIDFSGSSLTDRDKLTLIQSIFSMEKGYIRSDILTCNQTYKSLPVLLKASPEGWSESRNSLLTCVVNAISNESTKSVHKGVTGQLHSLVKPSFISSLLFASNLLIYSIKHSKLVLAICDKLHPAGSIACVRTSLNNLTMNVLQVPSGNILTAIDNDQVLIMKWTVVCKDNRAQISVSTSVCSANSSQWNTPMEQ